MTTIVGNWNPESGDDYTGRDCDDPGHTYDEPVVNFYADGHNKDAVVTNQCADASSAQPANTTSRKDNQIIFSHTVLSVILHLRQPITNKVNRKLAKFIIRLKAITWTSDIPRRRLVK